MMRSDSAAEAAFTTSATSTGCSATGSVTTVLCDAWYSSHIWRRRVGLPPATELGLARIASPDFPSIIANYANQFADGRPVKSASIGIKDSSGKYVAALCLNVDITLFREYRALWRSSRRLKAVRWSNILSRLPVPKPFASASTAMRQSARSRPERSTLLTAKP